LFNASAKVQVAHVRKYLLRFTQQSMLRQTVFTRAIRD